MDYIDSVKKALSEIFIVQNWIITPDDFNPPYEVRFYADDEKRTILITLTFNKNKEISYIVGQTTPSTYVDINTSDQNEIVIFLRDRFKIKPDLINENKFKIINNIVNIPIDSKNYNGKIWFECQTDEIQKKPYKIYLSIERKINLK